MSGPQIPPSMSLNTCVIKPHFFSFHQESAMRAAAVLLLLLAAVEQRSCDVDEQSDRAQVLLRLQEAAENFSAAAQAGATCPPREAVGCAPCAACDEDAGLSWASVALGHLASALIGQVGGRVLRRGHDDEADRGADPGSPRQAVLGRGVRA